MIQGGNERGDSHPLSHAKPPSVSPGEAAANTVPKKPPLSCCKLKNPQENISG